MSESSQTGFTVSKQMKVIAPTLVAVTVTLTACYFLFSRFNYDVLFQNLKPADASLAIKELELHEVDYRLKNRGADIHVPAKDLSKARLAIMGAEGPTKTTLGFELFNESEMGLTDFAQKIKYQRALQGELARTIMMMEGIEAARVHISMPERALFRNQKSQPRAAVTLLTEPEYELENSQILGIQSLIASSVNNMNLEGVVILNDSGGIVNAASGKTLPEPAAKDKFDPISETNQIQKIAVNTVVPTLKPDTEIGKAPSYNSQSSSQNTVSLLTSSQSNTPDEMPSQPNADISSDVKEIPFISFTNIKFDMKFWAVIVLILTIVLSAMFILLFRRPKTLARKEHMAFAEQLKHQLERYEEPFDVAA